MAITKLWLSKNRPVEIIKQLYDILFDQISNLNVVKESYSRVKDYVLFYNTERRHKAIGRVTPDERFYQEIKNVS